VSKVFRAALVAALSIVPLYAPGADSDLDTARIEALTGLKGSLDSKEHVFKITVPRTDLKASVAGVKLTPELGLSSWVAFMPSGSSTMMMGDLVLLESEVNPVMSTALDNGLQVTALHNHYFWDSPRLMYMHIGGMGEEDALARGVGKVFAEIKQLRGHEPAIPKVAMGVGRTTLDPKKIDRIIGTSGQLKDGVYKIVIGREANMGGHAFGKDMGVNTWAAFAGSDDKAIVDGDFAMTQDDLQGVLKAMRTANINIVAIHNHMTHEQPRYIFLHYWGTGSTESLAQGIRAALNAQK
jgi:hypothetical protein